MGRARERAEIAGLLEAGTRLVTLVGAGGCGKTRLAREVAADLASRRRAGIIWVELGGLSDGQLVTGAVATQLGAHEQPGTSPIGALAARVGDRDLVLVLDNCEHLVRACAALAAQLLRDCSALTLLATSREPLSIAGEVSYPVEPLPAPPPDARTVTEIRTSDAARLFELRARQVRPDLRLDDADASAVAEICRRLDGIPLAVELAAARTRTMTPTQVAAALSDRFGLLTGGPRDAPARQRTLQASIDWSHELLSAPQQALLARLSVFAASFDLEAARAVAGYEDDTNVLDGITALAERSLLQVVSRRGRARYRLLETIRIDARQRLDEDGALEATRDRHLAFHVELAHQARGGLTGPSAATWSDRLAAGIDDLRAAMDWALQSRRPVALLDIVEPTFRFLFDYGLYPELRRRLHAAIDEPGARESDRARGALTGALLAVSGGDFAGAHALASLAVPLLRANDVPAQLSLALVLRAYAGFAAAIDDEAQLDGDSQQAVALADECADPATRAYVLILAAQLAGRRASLPACRRLLERAVCVCEDEGVPFHLGAAEAYLGQWPALTADVWRARQHALRGVEQARRHARPGTQALALAGLATADLLLGEEALTRQHLGQARALLRDHGLERSLFDLGLHHWAALAAYRFGDPEEARAAAVGARDAARERPTHWLEAAAEWLLGVLALGAEQHDEAAAHLGRARQLAASPRTPFPLGRATLALAHLAVDRGDVDDAWRLAHEGLGILHGYGDRVGVADALEAVAAAAAARRQAAVALRVLAAVDGFREAVGVARFPLEAVRHQRTLAAAGVGLDVGQAESCRVEGAAMSLDETIAYVRRGRGDRSRPATGWASLTPTERALVRLVAEGCTNVQIGDRMFISPHTAKKHLSNVYAKLGVAGRAELVAEAARHDA